MAFDRCYFFVLSLSMVALPILLFLYEIHIWDWYVGICIVLRFNL